MNIDDAEMDKKNGWFYVLITVYCIFYDIRLEKEKIINTSLLSN